jgi:hypothetical protein
MFDDEDLAMAERHVRQAQAIVARQRERVLQLDSIGADTLAARQSLDLFETNLRIFEGHRDYLDHRRERG